MADRINVGGGVQTSGEALAHHGARDAAKMLPLRARQRARLLAEIRRASVVKFADQGFDEVTVDEIAAAVEISKSTFFRHVPTKEALLFDPLLEAISGVVQLFEDRPGSETVVEALCNAIVECTRTVSLPELSIWRRALRTAPHLIRRISLVSDDDREQLIQLAQSRIKSQDRTKEETLERAGLTVTVLLAASSYAFQRWILHDDDRESLEEELRNLLSSISIAE